MANSALPPRARDLADRNPEVWACYEQLGRAVAEAGPLDARTRRLVKLALSIGGGRQGAAHSHARRALDEGLGKEEIRHVALLAMPTLGLPATVTALSWFEDLE